MLEEHKICVIQKLAIVSLKYKTHVKNAIVLMFKVNIIKLIVNGKCESPVDNCEI